MYIYILLIICYSYYHHFIIFHNFIGNRRSMTNLPPTSTREMEKLPGLDKGSLTWPSILTKIFSLNIFISQG